MPARKKTVWQKIYSWFGFWHYTEHVLLDDKETVKVNKVFYWCVFPWNYYCKLDLFRISFKTYSQSVRYQKIKNFLVKNRK